MSASGSLTKVKGTLEVTGTSTFNNNVTIASNKNLTVGGNFRMNATSGYRFDVSENSEYTISPYTCISGGSTNTQASNTRYGSYINWKHNSDEHLFFNLPHAWNSEPTSTSYFEWTWSKDNEPIPQRLMRLYATGELNLNKNTYNGTGYGNLKCGNTTVTGTLDVTGTGNTTIGGTLDVYGATTLTSGTMEISAGGLIAGANNITANIEIVCNHAPTTQIFASFFTCRFNNTQIGDIGQATTSSVSYNTTSDYRLKTDVIDFTESLDLIKKLKVKKYKFIADKNENINQNYVGFLAHEVNIVSELFNTFCSGKKDDKQLYCKKCKSFYCSCAENCSEMEMRDKYQQIDYGKFTPYLVGAIQTLESQIESMDIIQQTHITKIASLESLVTTQEQIINELSSIITKLKNSSSFEDFKSQLI